MKSPIAIQSLRLLQTVAISGVKAGFPGAGAACKNCPEKFRKPKE
jgi:hypothetical protein